MNTTEIISALKIKGSFPTSNSLFSDADFLVLLNMCMDVEINPLVLKLNDEYFVETKDFAVAVGTKHRMPERSISLRDLSLVDSSGNVTPLNRNYEEDRPSSRTGYYVVRNSIELSSDITSGTLRMKYFARPSKLVLTTSAGQVESINTGTNQVLITSAPSNFASGASIDFIQNKNPFDLLAFDQTLSNISGTTLTFSSLPTGLAVGDWITPANQSPIPLVPQEMHTLLVHAALVSSLSSKKDKQAQYERDFYEQLKSDVVNMLDPRVNNSSAKMRTGRLHNYSFGR